MQGIASLLSQGLRWQGPPAWLHFLAEQRAHTTARHLRMQALLSRIDERARQAGIAFTALKGAALHAIGLYAAGDRPMADIDLLVRAADAGRTAEMLVALGFRLDRESWKERIFIALDERAPADWGEHAGRGLKIELHERICEMLPWRITDVSECVFPVHPHAGLNAYPSKASLMLHLLLHAAGSMHCSALRLVQLHDLALLSSRMNDADWSELLGCASRAENLWWAYPPLELMARYYDSRVPPQVLAALAHECRYWLRKMSTRRSLYDVSFSYLWVKAFPGIEWCRSIFEVAAFVANRVRPGAKHRALRDYVAASQAYAKQGDWLQLSQGRRILRWMWKRQTRPFTMYAVNAALAQPL
jgi:hypothetical protein